MRPLCSAQLLDGQGQLSVPECKALTVVCKKLDAHGAVHIAPIGMVILNLRQHGNLGHETKGLNEIVEHKIPLHPSPTWLNVPQRQGLAQGLEFINGQGLDGMHGKGAQSEGLWVWVRLNRPQCL